MNINGKIMGVRIYQSGKRYVTLDWEDPDIASRFSRVS